MQKMAGAANDHIFLDLTMEKKHPKEAQHHHWGGMEDDDVDGDYESTSIEFSSVEDSTNSIASSSSSDLVEDASFLPTSSSSSTLVSRANGPLYDLLDLLAQLPMKRDLSKFYQGKSQSYTSLASVNSIEDLPKKGTPYRSKMRLCKSYDGGMDGHNRLYGPRPTICKMVSRGSLLPSFRKER
uniref:Uncharacterized protein MANES_16G107900 n=1 Tax=Rhizophora mucronata TaxID=61149 RepID=A0A2P2P5Q7_RHIMU